MASQPKRLCAIWKPTSSVKEPIIRKPPCLKQKSLKVWGGRCALWETRKVIRRVRFWPIFATVLNTLRRNSKIAARMSEHPQKFLVIRLSSIGDIVHTLPAVAALGNTFPDAEITWAVETRYACLLKNNPYLKRLITLDTLEWRRNLSRIATLRE